MAGVYQPRSRGAAMADALADARRALARLTQIAILRGAGRLLLLGALAAAGCAGSATTPAIASLNNATGRDAANLSGRLRRDRRRSSCCRPSASPRSPSSRRSLSGACAR